MALSSSLCYLPSMATSPSPTRYIKAPHVRRTIVTSDLATSVVRLHNQGVPTSALATRFGVSVPLIRQLIRGLHPIQASQASQAQAEVSEASSA